MQFDQFQVNEVVPKCLHSYFVALIPKIESPLVLDDYRLISLLGILYKILSKSSGRINIQRGSKQGDPRALFLFLLVAEGYSGLIRNAVRRNLFKG
ncbi:hypothetical protein MTR_1g040325 [Medicago truncatula]|uniref:Uncharacterized protein n=1 Tax=Medicago truncatula TaxID=3880 RepID=A0A072VHS6_MEDTR|nr:hypothetical protein MTR_1g040325 [Medicago truncatula]